MGLDGFWRWPEEALKVVEDWERLDDIRIKIRYAAIKNNEEIRKEDAEREAEEAVIEAAINEEKRIAEAEREAREAAIEAAELERRKAKRTEVFVSYSHKDIKFRIELDKHLSGLRKHKRIGWWTDDKLVGGDKWYNEIMDALSRAKVFILLVSVDFIDSDFICNEELPKIVTAKEEEDAELLWVRVRDCDYESTLLKDYQATYFRPPLKQRKPVERDTIYTELVKRIKAIFCDSGLNED